MYHTISKIIFNKTVSNFNGVSLNFLCDNLFQNNVLPPFRKKKRIDFDQFLLENDKILWITK